MGEDGQGPKHHEGQGQPSGQPHTARQEWILLGLRRFDWVGHGQAHEAPRSEDQDRGHHQKLSHQGELGKHQGHPQDVHRAQRNAKGLGLGNQKGRHISPRDRAQSPNHHHDKGLRHTRQVQSEVGRFSGHLQSPGPTRQGAAECKHTGKKPGLIHPQGRHHVAILTGRTHQNAKTCFLENPPQCAHAEGAHRNQEQVVARKRMPQDGDRPAQSRCSGAHDVLWAPNPKGCIFDHQHQCKGPQQLHNVAGFGQAFDHEHLHQGAQCSGHDATEENGLPKGPRRPWGTQARAQSLKERHRTVKPHHVKGAMGKVHHARHPKDERQARRHQEQGRCLCQAVEELNEEGGELHGLAARSRGGANAAQDSVERAQFFDLVGGGLKFCAIHVFGVHQDAFAVVVFGFSDKSAHGGLLVFGAEGDFPKRTLNHHATRSRHQFFSVVAAGLFVGLGDGFDHREAHHRAQARVVVVALLIGRQKGAVLGGVEATPGVARDHPSIGGVVL